MSTKPSLPSTASRRISPRKIVVDSIHGSIDLSDSERKVIDTASFQRLRYLKQLGLGHVTYPNASHTRFAHSLGVLAIMSKVIGAAREQLTLDEQTCDDLRLCALLHDVGHYPYSHLMERLDRVTLTEELTGTRTPRPLALGRPVYPNHEDLGSIIVTEQEDLRSALGGLDRANRIASLFTRSEAADVQISKLIHSSLDMDRLDFLLRDARAVGVPYGEIDIDYLLNNLRASPTGMIGIALKALPAAEQFLIARYFMYRTVYYHKTTYGMEEALRQLLRRCRDENIGEVPKDGDAVRRIARDPSLLLDFTDNYVDRVVHAALGNPDGVIKRLARCIAFRKPPSSCGRRSRSPVSPKRRGNDTTRPPVFSVGARTAWPHSQESILSNSAGSSWRKCLRSSWRNAGSC